MKGNEQETPSKDAYTSRSSTNRSHSQPSRAIFSTSEAHKGYNESALNHEATFFDNSNKQNDHSTKVAICLAVDEAKQKNETPTEDHYTSRSITNRSHSQPSRADFSTSEAGTRYNESAIHHEATLFDNNPLKKNDHNSKGEICVAVDEAKQKQEKPSKNPYTSRSSTNRSHSQPNRANFTTSEACTGYNESVTNHEATFFDNNDFKQYGHSGKGAICLAEDGISETCNSDSTQVESSETWFPDLSDNPPVYKSPSTSIHCIEKPENLRCRTRCLAIKIVKSSKEAVYGSAEARPTPGKVSCLYNEYILSRHLGPECSSIRAALRYQRTERFHAIYMEWAAGVTLLEWLNSVRAIQQTTSPSILVTTRLAWEIARAVADIHERGVVHNNLTAENIIVDIKEHTDHDFNFNCKLIDLGLASLWKRNDLNTNSITLNKQRKDLVSVGCVFYDMFVRSEHCFLSDLDPQHVDTLDPACHAAKRSNISDKQTEVPPLHERRQEGLEEDARVPISISNLVSNLMGIGAHEDSFRSAREVEKELNFMLVDPDRFLFDRDKTALTDVLEFPPGRLYGREDELSLLTDVVERVVTKGGASEVVLVSGQSGTGKTALVEQVERPVIERHGYFLAGKFNRLGGGKPLSSIIAAFSQYFEMIVREGQESISRARTILRRGVGTDCALLSRLIPGLDQIIGDPNNMGEVSKVQDPESQNRLRVIFRMLIKIIASIHPVVLFLDDMQWADISSLGLIQSLVTDGESKAFLFIGAYRDDEVDVSHPLAVTLRDIEEMNVPLTPIRITNISKEDTNDLISDTLSLSRRLVRPLTDIIHDHTGGNVFFLIQLLRSLWDENLLFFSWESRRWKWDKSKIDKFTDDVLHLMTRKIVTFPPEAQNALKIASCLGFECTESVINCMAGGIQEEMDTNDECSSISAKLSHAIESFPKKLDVAVRQELLQKERGTYRFRHDSIRDAAYLSIAEAEKSMWHLWIGKCIQKNTPAERVDDVLFVMVNQLNLGNEYISDESKVKLARLNLEAGEKAMNLSAFGPAAAYLRTALSLLTRNSWDSHYDLSLKLHESLARAEHCNGKLNSVGMLVSSIFQHAKSFDDKIGAYPLLIATLGNQGKLTEAIETGFVVLEMLGESFPGLTDELNGLDPTREPIISNEMHLTRDMLDGYTDETLMKMDLMQDEKKIAAMKILCTMALYCYVSNSQLLALLSFRMMQLSLTHGVCEESAVGFALYGSLLCVIFAQPKRGYQFGQFALSLLGRCENKRCLGRVYGAVYGCINPFNEHLPLSCGPTLEAFSIGLRYGDIEFAFANLHLLCCHSFESGVPLDELNDMMKKFCRQMAEFKQYTMLTVVLPYRQTVLNLLGESNNPLELTGDAMDQEQFLQRAIDMQHSSATWIVFCLRTRLAYYYGDFDSAASLVEGQNMDKPYRYDRCNCAFFEGLVSLAFARKSREEKWEARAVKAINQMKNWAEDVPRNCKHKLDLMMAESAVYHCNYVEATNAYESAILAAGENGFIQDKALAYERAGLFYLSRGDTKRASQFLDNAYNAYLEWGARGKADHVRCQSLSLVLSAP